MVIISMESFPPESANEMGKRFLESPPLPAYMTMKGPYVSFEVGVGIKDLNVYEFDQSKLKEALEVVSNRYIKYFALLKSSINFYISLNFNFESRLNIHLLPVNCIISSL